MDKQSKVTELNDSDTVNRLDSWLSPVINSVMTYKGQRSTMDDLPKTDNRLGDVYYVVSEEKQYAYNGMSWELIDDTHGEGGSSFVNYKGIKDTVAELPSDGNEVGDTWYVSEDSSMYLWNGTSWDSLGEEVATDEDGHIIEVGTVSEVHVDDIADVASADGRLVPNLNTVKSYVDVIGDSVDEAVQNANDAVATANEAYDLAQEAASSLYIIEI